MTICDELIELYKRTTRNFDFDLSYYLRTGFVFSGPHYFLMGKRIGDGWYVHCAVGRQALREFGHLMPTYLPFTGWRREGKSSCQIMWFPTDSVLRRLTVELPERFEIQRARFSRPNLIAQLTYQKD